MADEKPNDEPIDAPEEKPITGENSSLFDGKLQPKIDCNRN